MRFIRFNLKSDPKGVEKKGIMDENFGISVIHGSIFMGYSVTDEHYELTEVNFLPPVLPTNIICLNGGNAGYIKSPNSLAGSGVELVAHKNLRCMPRVARIMDPRGKNNVFGIALMFDFTVVGADGVLLLRSFADNHTVTGPCIFTSLKDNETIEFYQNGNKLTMPMPECNLSALNGYKLRPGDIVADSLMENALSFPHNTELILRFRKTDLRAYVVGAGHKEC